MKLKHREKDTTNKEAQAQSSGQAPATTQRAALPNREQHVSGNKSNEGKKPAEDEVLQRCTDGQHKHLLQPGTHGIGGTHGCRSEGKTRRRKTFKKLQACPNTASSRNTALSSTKCTRLQPLEVVLNACHKINISTSIKKHLGQIARRTTQHRQGKLERHTGGRKQTSLKKTRTLRMHTLRLQVSLGK